MVAGLIDKDEQPEEVAHREGEEEAGLTFSALWPITKYFPSPGGSTEFVHLYLGRCSAGVGGLHGLEEEAEDIRVTTWAFEDALQAVRDGDFQRSQHHRPAMAGAESRGSEGVMAVKAARSLSRRPGRAASGLRGQLRAADASAAGHAHSRGAAHRRDPWRPDAWRAGPGSAAQLPVHHHPAVRQEHSLPWLPVPQLEVQVYHDARMAEVISAEHARRFRSIYPYPNAACTSRMKSPAQPVPR
jgi:8-oxo-dGTP pyrophosphatase MutT (NUDIX family)